MGKRGPQPDDPNHGPSAIGRAKQRQQDEDRHEAAGLPRKHVEADDLPDDNGRP